MRVNEAIVSIHRSAGSWVRLQGMRRLPKGLELSFSVHKGERGKRIDGWQVSCQKVHEAKISAWDGGGLLLYDGSHPAARQYTARRAEVRWEGDRDETDAIGALYLAHIKAVDDWIPFERYSSARVVSRGKVAWRGPDFLMHAYAKALRSIGREPKVLARRGNRTVTRTGVLHFGDSYVVAETFAASHCG
jgi:hypothetical protein